MQEEKVDSNDEEKSELDENDLSSNTEEEQIKEEDQDDEEKARVNDRRRFNSEENDDSIEDENKGEIPSLVPSYVELLEKKVSIAFCFLPC